MSATTPRKTLYIIFVAFAVLILLVNLVIPATGRPLSALAVIVSGVGAALCVYWSLVRMMPSGELPSFAKFQSDFLIAMAGAELVGITGVFLGSGPTGPAPFALVSWFLMFAVVLPRVRQYWKVHDSART